MASIRHQIYIAAGSREIWRALTTAEGLTSWLADEARVDGRKGGRFVLVGEDDEGNPVEERGMIHHWRPTSHLEVAWDSVGSFPTRGTRLSFKLARDGEETRLSLVHSGGGILDDEEQREQLNVDWRRALRSLQSMLDAAD